jgi:hypothetical protein
MGIENAEFDADFESIDKVANNSCEISYQRKSDRKMEFLTYITVCKSFPSIFFLMIFFALFSTDSSSALNFAFYDNHIEFLKQYFFLILALFANFKAKIGRKV